MTCDLYLFHVKSIVIPVFNSSYNLFSYSVCKVSTGTYNLQSVMLNFKLDGVLIVGTSSNAGGSSSAFFCSLVVFSINTRF